VIPCRLPGALEKCLGWNAAIGAAQCGESYLQGSYLCSACARSYYLFDDGTCLPCPSAETTFSKYEGLFILFGSVAGFALTVFLTIQIAAKAAGLSTRGSVKVRVSTRVNFSPGFAIMPRVNFSVYLMQGVLTLIVQLMTILQACRLFGTPDLRPPSHSLLLCPIPFPLRF